MGESAFRALPSVDRLLQDARLRGWAADDVLLAVAREAVEAARTAVAAGGPAPSYEAIADDARRRLDGMLAPPLRPLINATGVVLHTNLGRAPLAEEAIEAMAAASRGYSDLEFEVESGRRGSRHALLEPLLTRLTGAEAAMAVNNNAAAVLLALSAIA